MTAEVVCQIAILLCPSCRTSRKLLDLVAACRKARFLRGAGEAGRLVSGTPLEAPTPVFPRYVAPEA